MFEFLLFCWGCDGVAGCSGQGMSGFFYWLINVGKMWEMESIVLRKCGLLSVELSCGRGRSKNTAC